MMTHRALIHEYTSSIIALDLDADDNPLICMPLYHSAGMHVFMLPYLAVGATVRLMPAPDIPRDPAARRGVRDRFAVPGTDGVGAPGRAPPTSRPATCRRCARRSTARRSCRSPCYSVCVSATPTSASTTASASPRSGRWQRFSAPQSTTPDPHRAAVRCSSSRPASSTPTATTSPVGEPGEILYRSPQLCQGYWDNPTATEEAFRDGWFHSGDLVTRDEEGYVTVVDRIKDVINTGGILVASREVEDAIYTHAAVAEVAVIGTPPDDKWIEAITAVVVLRAEAVVTEAELIDHVKQQLAPFKVPKLVKFVEELPRNQSGKLLKRELRA